MLYSTPFPPSSSSCIHSPSPHTRFFVFSLSLFSFFFFSLCWRPYRSDASDLFIYLFFSQENKKEEEMKKKRKNIGYHTSSSNILQSPFPWVRPSSCHRCVTKYDTKLLLTSSSLLLLLLLLSLGCSSGYRWNENIMFYVNENVLLTARIYTSPGPRIPSDS